MKTGLLQKQQTKTTSALPSLDDNREQVYTFMCGLLQTIESHCAVRITGLLSISIWKFAATKAQTKKRPWRKKTVFGVSDIVRLKLVSSATQTSLKIKTSLVGSLDMVLSKKWITKALIRLVYFGYTFALFANLRRKVFSRQGPLLFDHYYTPPQTLFVVGILFSRCPCVRPCVCASVRPSVSP